MTRMKLPRAVVDSMTDGLEECDQSAHARAPARFERAVQNAALGGEVSLGSRLPNDRPHIGLCWINFATSAVQPVWCVAPRPAPVSPWKYSWNVIQSRKFGSVAKRSTPPSAGRAPPG